MPPTPALFQPPRRSRHRRLQLLLAVGTLVCTAIAFGMTGSPERITSHPSGDKKSPLVMLIGEVHDNAAQHAIQEQTLEMLFESGIRPALLMEQINRERQAEIDHLLASGKATADDIARVAQQGNEGGNWNWDYYRPLVELALRYELPIIAANISRSDTHRIIQDGLARHGFDNEIPDDIASAQTQQMIGAHCGLIGKAAGRLMVTAQVARDQYMASLVAHHAGRGVILIAGNGHVRRDIGVPRWLSAELQSRAISVGLVENENSPSAAFDRVITTPPQERPDPCLAMRDSLPRAGHGI